MFFRFFSLPLNYSRTPVPPFPRTSEFPPPVGGRLGGGLSSQRNIIIVILLIACDIFYHLDEWREVDTLLLGHTLGL